MSLFDLQKIECKERNKRESQTNEENSSTKWKQEKYMCKESWVRRFKQAWNEEFPWVEFDEVKNLMFCAVCWKHPSVCGKSSSLFLGIVGSLSSGFYHDILVSHN